MVLGEAGAATISVDGKEEPPEGSHRRMGTEYQFVHWKMTNDEFIRQIVDELLTNLYSKIRQNSSKLVSVLQNSSPFVNISSKQAPPRSRVAHAPRPGKRGLERLALFEATTASPLVKVVALVSSEMRCLFRFEARGIAV